MINYFITLFNKNNCHFVAKASTFPSFWWIFFIFNFQLTLLLGGYSTNDYTIGFPFIAYMAFGRIPQVYCVENLGTKMFLECSWKVCMYVCRYVHYNSIYLGTRVFQRYDGIEMINSSPDVFRQLVCTSYLLYIKMKILRFLM